MRLYSLRTPERRSTLSSAGRFILLAGHLTATNALVVEAVRATGVDARWLPPEDAVLRAREGDTVLARLDIAPTLDGPEPGMAELRYLVEQGLDVLNQPAALLASHDKLLTAAFLRRARLPHPRTAYAPAGTVPEVTDFPVVVKPRFGSWGRDVELCVDSADLERCLRRLSDRSWFRRQGVLVQELIPPVGRDLRIVVAGGSVVGAIERVSPPGEWRTNVALGARRRRVEPPADACATALAAAAVVGGDLVGVDLLPCPDGGWVVLELNGAVDFTDDYSLDGASVFDRVVAMLAPVSQELFGFAGHTVATYESSSSTMSPQFATP